MERIRPDEVDPGALAMAAGIAAVLGFVFAATVIFLSLERVAS